MNKQNNDWKIEWNEFKDKIDWDNEVNEEEFQAMTDFVENLLKEQLNRVNKEVIMGDEEVKNFENLSLQIVYGYKPKFRNELRLEQRQKLDLMKGDIK